MVRSRRQELESVGPGLESPSDVGRYTNRVAWMYVEELIVELDRARARQNHVDLLRLLVAMRERGPFAGAKPEMRKPGLLGFQRYASYARLPAVPEPTRHGGVLDVVEVDPRVSGGPLAFIRHQTLLSVAKVRCANGRQPG
jgi:hypothetical protein